MKAKRFLSIMLTLLLAASVAFLASCQSEEIAPMDPQGDAIAAKAPPTTPFKGRYTTYPNIVDDTGGILIVEIPSVGNATKLGNSIWYSDSEVRANTNPPWAQTGTMYFEDSKGDRLIGSFVGTSYPIPPTNPFAGSGTYTITSGTGKYTGATGTGTYEYIVSPELIGDLTFTGTLTVPKGK